MRIMLMLRAGYMELACLLIASNKPLNIALIIQLTASESIVKQVPSLTKKKEEISGIEEKKGK